MTSLVIVLVGLMAWSWLTVREYANIDEPLVSVTTSYNGALAEVIESQVTQPLEDALSIIEGLDLMTSSNGSESSQITLQFRVTRESAATLRLRSILMATGAMVLGSVPLVLAEGAGAGAESRLPPPRNSEGGAGLLHGLRAHIPCGTWSRGSTVNITLSVDEQTVQRAPRVAPSLSKSLNQVVCEYLEQLAYRDQVERDIAEFRALSQQHGSKSPAGWEWNREEIYGRKIFSR